MQESCQLRGNAVGAPIEGRRAGRGADRPRVAAGRARDLVVGRRRGLDRSRLNAVRWDRAHVVITRLAVENILMSTQPVRLHSKASLRPPVDRADRRRGARVVVAPLAVVVVVALATLLGGCRRDEAAPIEQLPVAERPTNFVEGEIVIAPELRDRVGSDGVVFVFLRKPEAGRMPIATLRGNFPVFPYKFVVGEANVLFDNFGFEGEMTLHARYSKTGNAMGAPGDLEGDCTTNPVTPGQRGLTIVLDKVVEERRESPMIQRPGETHADYE